MNRLWLLMTDFVLLHTLMNFKPKSVLQGQGQGQGYEDLDIQLVVEHSLSSLW